MKKILMIAGSAAVLLCLAAAVLVHTWADTGHGRLDYKVAVILKFLNAKDDGGGQRPSVAESRRLLVEKVRKYGSAPVAVKLVADRTFPGPAGPVPIRVYTPDGTAPLPVIVFYHGGGWVQGDFTTHDNLCRYLANAAKALVVAVAYRLAPEHPFPAGVEDAYAALVWTAENAGVLNGDPRRIAVMGDSAGGNLSAVVSLMARDRQGPAIRRQVLVYPATDLSRLDTDSYNHFGGGFMLTRDKIVWFRRLYMPDEKNWTDPLASPLLAADHGRLPPATIITAQMDPLRDDGKRYAQKLRQAGVPTRYHCFDGMIHGFVSADKVLGQAHEALDEIAADLNASFQAGP